MNSHFSSIDKSRVDGKRIIHRDIGHSIRLMKKRWEACKRVKEKSNREKQGWIN